MNVDEKITTVQSSDEVEAWLTKRAVKFKRPATIDIDLIDEKASQKNQARADGVTKSVVDKYIDALRNGDLFPPVVVYKRGDRYIIIDGNHRLTASKRYGAKKIWVYEANPSSSELIELLTAEANSRHGYGVASDWRARQAVYLVSLGHSVETVANALTMTVHGVRKALRVAETDARAARLGITDFDSLTASTKIRIAGLPTDAQFVKVVELVRETKFSAGNEFSTFVSDIRRIRSDSEALEFIEEMRKTRLSEQSFIPTKSKRRIANPKLQVVTALGSVLALDPEQLNQIFLLAEERTEIARRLGDASLKLMECEEILRG